MLQPPFNPQPPNVFCQAVEQSVKEDAAEPDQAETRDLKFEVLSGVVGR